MQCHGMPVNNDHSVCVCVYVSKPTLHVFIFHIFSFARTFLLFTPFLSVLHFSRFRSLALFVCLLCCGESSMSVVCIGVLAYVYVCTFEISVLLTIVYVCLRVFDLFGWSCVCVCVCIVAWCVVDSYVCSLSPVHSNDSFRLSISVFFTISETSSQFKVHSGWIDCFRFIWSLFLSLTLCPYKILSTQWSTWGIVCACAFCDSKTKTEFHSKSS